MKEKKDFRWKSLFVLAAVFTVLAAAVVNGAAYTRECEDYNSLVFGGIGTSGVRLEGHSNASGGQAIHIGPDWSPDTTWGIDDQAVYTVDLQAQDNASIKVKYTDDVAGNVIKVYLDDVEKGLFFAFYTGGWNNFEWTNPISLGSISAGQHTIKLKMTTGGSYGILLDVFKIESIEDKVVAFLKSSINPNTGMVESLEGGSNDFTTIYKNALAAMVFIHEGDMNSATGIFDFFKSVYDADPNNFQGFIKDWDAGTGQPVSANYWSGDNAFLLMALNYYNQANNGLGVYADMSDALVEWLTEEGNNCGSLIGEGAADIYAALAPFEGDEDIDMALIKLKARFYDDVAYDFVLDHTTRGSLVFGDIDGFNYVDDYFARTDVWSYDNTTTVSAYSAFSTENFINLEISAQLLNAWGVWQSDVSVDLSGLEKELEKAWLNGTTDPNSCGLPYYLISGNPDDYGLPIIDSTSFMYYYWNFNPYAPGEKYAAVSFDFGECEDYNSVTFGGVGTNGIRLEAKTNASSNQVIHIGPDWSPDNTWGTDDQVVCNVILQAYDNASIRIRYADDVAGNVFKVYLDDVEKGQFTTADTGTWNDFEWTEPISLGAVTEGEHSIKLKMTTGGSYGAGLDVFKIEWRNIVHFSVPYSPRQQANYSGAACLKMALDYEGTNSYAQSELHSYGVANNSAENQGGSYIDPQGMYLAMNNKELSANYNYGNFSRSAISDAYHDICHWIAYSIPVPDPYSENMPAMIPTGGNYENWVIVNGYNASDDAWTASSYTVYGFWITDPAVSGIGQNVYKTAAELANSFVPLATSDSWNGYYVSVCEPPVYDADVTIAKPVKFKDKLASKQDIIDAAVKGLEDNVLNSDSKIKAAYIGSRPGKPVKVCKGGDKYFVVPFIKNDGCAVAVIVDAKNGAFREASYSGTPDIKYLKRLLKSKDNARCNVANAFLLSVD